jgi:hypothetical protein
MIGKNWAIFFLSLKIAIRNPSLYARKQIKIYYDWRGDLNGAVVIVADCYPTGAEIGSHRLGFRWSGLEKAFLPEKYAISHKTRALVIRIRH